MAQDHLAEDIREAFSDQIAQLRKQLDSITDSLGDNGIDIDDIRDDARGIAKGAAKNVQRVAHFAQSEAGAVAKVARRNPAGASTALTLVAAIGFGIGYAVCQMQHEQNHRHWW